MAHVHSWRTSRYILLTLPDSEHHADIFVQWRCLDCPLYSEIDGNVRVGAPLGTPEYWHAIDRVRPWKRNQGARQWEYAQRKRGR
jgi:hypothetical protein